jgi:hypothetical protein
MTRTGRTTRYTAASALAGVSLIAAVISYLHALAVVRAVGATPPVVYLIPFLADLVILGASASLLDAAASGRGKPRLATMSLATGVGVTLAMNVAAGLGHGVAGGLVAGWPAVAFVLSLESLAVIVRSNSRAAAGVTRRGVVAPVIHDDTPAVAEPVPAGDGGNHAEIRRLLTVVPALSVSQIADRANVSKSTVHRVKRQVVVGGRRGLSAVR